MKRFIGRKWMVLVIVLGLLIPFRSRAAEDPSSGETNSEMVQAQTEEKIWDMTDTRTVDQELKKLFPEEKIHFRDVVEAVIGQNEGLPAEKIRTFLTDQLFYVLKVNKPVLASLILMVLIASVFSNFSEVFQNKQLSRIAFLLVYLSMITILIRSFQAAEAEIGEGLENLIRFMKVLCPVYFVCMAVAVGSVSAIGFYNLVIFLIFLAELVILKLVIPLIHLCIFMQILNHLTEEDYLSRAAELVQLIVNWSLKTLLALVTGMGIVQGIVSPAIDEVRRSVWTKGVQVIPGVGDLIGGTTEVVLGTAVLLKKGVGVAGAVLVIALVLVPVVNMGILTILYKGTAALVQPVSDKRITAVLGAIGEGYQMLLKIVLTTAVLFLVTIAVAAAAVSS